MIDTTLVNTTEISDFTVGSIILSIYESVAMELEQFYVLTDDNIKWGIEHGIYESFGFHRREARRAYGKLRIDYHTALRDSVYIPAGALFKSSITGLSQQYETIEPYYVPAGSNSAYVTVYCTEAGLGGNISKGAIDTIMSNLSFVSRVTNVEDFLTGADQESLDNVKERFREFIDTRGRATKKAIAYGVKQVEDISGVYIAESTGYVKVYAHDKNGNLSQRLVEEIVAKVEDYRPVGIQMDVVPVERVDVNLDVDIYITRPEMKSDAMSLEIEKMLRTYLNSKTASDDLTVSEIIRLVMNLDNTLIYDCEITNMQENLQIAEHELIRAGTIRVTLK